MQTAMMKHLPLGSEFKHDLHGDIISRIISTDPLKFAVVINGAIEMKASFTPDENESNLPVFIVSKEVECPLCKGKKKWPCVAKLWTKGGFVDQPAVMMDCHVCDKTGSVNVVKYANNQKEEDDFWCTCGNKNGSTFFDDGEGSACSKHHYVCNDCGKVSQVG